MTETNNYYSIKIFLLFRLAQIPYSYPWLILHNQLQLTRFARRLRIPKMKPIVQNIDTKSKDNRKTLGTSLRQLGFFGKAGENGGNFHTLCEE